MAPDVAALIRATAPTARVIWATHPSKRAGLASMADDDVIEVDLTGPDLLSNPLLNKGTAFTESERDTFELHGFLPPHIGSLEDQIRRRMEALRAQPDGCGRYVFLRGLPDANEPLFHSPGAPNL